MFGQLFTALLAFLITGSAHAQVSAPNCSDYTSNYTWVGYHWLVAEFVINARSPRIHTQSYNSLGQSPCLVVAYLAAVCNNGGQYIPLLTIKLCMGFNQPT